MLRPRFAVASMLALACSLTGCVGSTPDTAGTAIELPDIVTETPTTEAPAPEATGDTTDRGNGPETDGDAVTTESGPADATASPAPGATATAQPDSSQPETTDPQTSLKDCVIVAAGVSSILLAPLSLLGGTDSDNVDRLHEQIDDLRSMVPPELADDFDRLQDVVPASTQDGGTFDEAAYRAAVAPIEEWLHQHCSDPLQ
ncbi:MULTISPECIES: hypothetical protein [unclassified Arthrobacter]|uniref:hypothetical protein n=1 Tax=unclassified Arthrobacter TaxID=235627 RepID=UPI0014921149|nr:MULTISPECIES: hypothetical protein [unclassified Arthrobacter]MBE0008313.1 hypothetical protein [Arthrobacter sp. AET 35A]NOJ62052.1 hypothetical protein [Arthrobacter sp. 147(2020)]